MKPAIRVCSSTTLKSNQPLSLNKEAEALMKNVFYNKDLKTNLSPTEYDKVKKVIKFRATPNDGRSPFNLSVHIDDIKNRIQRGIFIKAALAPADTPF